MRRNIQKEVVVVAVDNKKKRKVSHRITINCDNFPNTYDVILLQSIVL
jgi:hypothetical protein